MNNLNSRLRLFSSQRYAKHRLMALIDMFRPNNLSPRSIQHPSRKQCVCHTLAPCPCWLVGQSLVLLEGSGVGQLLSNNPSHAPRQTGDDHSVFQIWEAHWREHLCHDLRYCHTHNVEDTSSLTTSTKSSHDRNTVPTLKKFSGSQEEKTFLLRMKMREPVWKPRPFSLALWWPATLHHHSRFSASYKVFALS